MLVPCSYPARALLGIVYVGEFSYKGTKHWLGLLNVRRGAGLG